jgi:hypothetical protein
MMVLSGDRMRGSLVSEILSAWVQIFIVPGSSGLPWGVQCA